MSLRADIKEVLKNVGVSLHMPAHKYSKEFEYIDKCDTTEIFGTDNLHEARGVILKAEKRASNFYGSSRTRFLVGGSTVGILSAIYGTCYKGDKILISRDSHKSVYNACRISGLNYTTVMPEISESMLPCGYGEGVENFFLKYLKDDPSVRVVVLNSPNYYGYITDVRKISDELKKRNGILIVDEAHGAHLEFCGLSDYSALNNGADIVIQSTHKTLPAMTMTALLHYGKNISSHIVDKVEKALTMFQSSSPSYPLMFSIDEALEYMDIHRKENADKMKLFKNFRESLPNILTHSVPEPKDPSKLFLDSSKFGYTGYQFDEFLRKNGIFTEFAMENGVLFYLSVVNTKDEISKTLEVIMNMEKRKPIECKAYFYPKVEGFFLQDLSARIEKLIPLKESSGKISAEDIIPYPPGIPIILAGEIINNDVIRAINCYNNMTKIKIYD